MKTRTTRILYWVLTILFVVSMLLDGIAGLMRVEDGKTAMIELGYPLYILTILGLAKILGAIAILQTAFQTIKEWAYAGFAFIFIGAFLSRAFVGDNPAMLFPPLVVLVFMFATYYLWKKVWNYQN